MKTCQDMENLLSFYTEGALTDDERRAVEEHLAHCEACRRELAALQQAARMVEALPPVETPPWFEQKIMAGVRREASKKRFVQKWFYPLGIKIPLQVMATLVIAVLAVLIYRGSEDSVKDLLPGVTPPAMELSQEKAADDPALLEDSVVQPSEKKSVHDAAGGRQKAAKEKAAERIVKNEHALSPTSPLMKAADKGRDRAFAQNESEAPPAPDVRGKEQKSFAIGGEDRTDAMPERPQAAMMKKEDAPRLSAPASRAIMASVGEVLPVTVRLYVKDAGLAMTAVEKMLTDAGAAPAKRQEKDGQWMIQSDVPAFRWKDVLDGLKGLGHLEELKAPGQADRTITVRIEMVLED